jgi:bacteriocin-like protein
MENQTDLQLVELNESELKNIEGGLVISAAIALTVFGMAYMIGKDVATNDDNSECCSCSC